MTRSPIPLARRDVVIAGALIVLCVVLFAVIGDPGEPAVGSAKRDLGALAFVLIALPVLWRRAAPVLAAAGFLAAVAAHMAVFGMFTRCGLVLPLSFVLAFGAGSAVPARPGLVAVALVCAGDAVMLLNDGSADPGAMVLVVPIALAVFYGGRMVRSRSELADTLREHNAELRAAREENARLEVANDRVRLSGQLDDLLRSRLGELARLAESGAGDDAVGAFARIESDSRATLEQMRATVDLLRGEDPADATAPQPTLVSLEALVTQRRGTDARIAVTGDPRVLPAGLELSAFRVVEHLLAATEDAPGVEVTVDFGADALELTVRGPAKRRAEAAVERARERVALHHGTLADRSRGGRTEITAAFPVLATA